MLQKGFVVNKSTKTVSRGRKRAARLAGASALAAFALIGVGVSPVFADTSEGGNWDAPPTCFKDGAEIHQHVNNDGTELQGVYSYLFEYSYRRYYGNGYETRYIWVYQVENLTGGSWEMTTNGFAHKLCGGTWTQTSSNVG